MSERWVVGITGASGTIYAVRLVQVIAERLPEIELHVVITDDALRVIREEHAQTVSGRTDLSEQLFGLAPGRIHLHNNRDIGASIASGSFRTQGMVIIPCSVASLAAVSHGLADNLLRRAAQVSLKERRKLIVVPRETPLSVIDLENMVRLAHAGACIVPAMPGFYHQPRTIAELVDMLVMKVLDQMGYDIPLVDRWGSHS